MSILLLAAIHKKKDTRLGTFAHQMQSQGNSSVLGPDISL